MANALALFQGNSGNEVLPGLSLSDLSSTEQGALIEAKRKKNADGATVVNPGPGSGSSGSEGVVGITKLDIMSLLKEQSEVATHATKILLSEHTEQI